MITDNDVFRIGTITKVHGTRGEVNMVFTDDVFDRAEVDFLFCRIDGLPVPYYIEEYRFRNDTTALVKFEGIDSAEAARRLVGAEVSVERSCVPEEAADSYTWTYFTGFEVIDAHAGMLGRVEAVDDSTMNVLFEVMPQQGGQPLLVPAAEAFIDQIDHDKRILYVSLPEGLLTLHDS